MVLTDDSLTVNFQALDTVSSIIFAFFSIAISVILYMKQRNFEAHISNKETKIEMFKTKQELYFQLLDIFEFCIELKGISEELSSSINEKENFETAIKELMSKFIEIADDSFNNIKYNKEKINYIFENAPPNYLCDIYTHYFELKRGLNQMIFMADYVVENMKKEFFTEKMNALIQMCDKIITYKEIVIAFFRLELKSEKL